MEFMIILSILIVVALASVAWGVDSRDGVNSGLPVVEVESWDRSVARKSQM